MRTLVTGKQMKVCDRNMIEYYGIPSIVLMERASISFVQQLHKQGVIYSKVLIYCGRGNNGGDGYAIARMLKQEGADVTIVVVGGIDRISDETMIQREICRRYHIPMINLEQSKQYQPDLVIDGVLGNGLNREVKDDYEKSIMLMNQFNANKWAIDVPSGISSDTGEVLGVGFEADYTVTFAYGKVGIYLGEGAIHAGQVITTDIGIGQESWLEYTPTYFAMEPSDVERLPVRMTSGNKGTFGKVLIIAGSREMSGACYLAAKAAYKSGCGLVYIYTHEANRTIIATQLPEAIIHTYNQYNQDQLETELIQCDSIVLGPGIGLSDTAQSIVQYVLRRSEVPLVLDGDALTIVAENMEWIRQSVCPCVFTPHPKEMSRLSGQSVSIVKKHAIELAQSLSKEYNIFCILKDARTVIALTNGRTYINTTGNCGMGTGGSGDVLAGILGALLCMLAPIEDSLTLGVMAHGLAGDIAVKTCGEYGLLASDIIDGLAQVWPRR